MATSECTLCLNFKLKKVHLESYLYQSAKVSIRSQTAIADYTDRSDS